MKNVIQFGAGNIGRGFIGYLLSKSGFHVIFADVIEEIIDTINSENKYLVEILGEDVKKEYVENISAINSMDEKLINEISKVNLITTAVGPNVLKIIAKTLALGIERRYKENNIEYLNIIPCENMVGAGDYLKDEVKGYLDGDVIKYLDKYVGFVNSAVDRIVPPMEGDVENIIHVRVEDFNEWIVDKNQFKGDLPNIKGISYTDNLKAYTERKIFTLNTGHAITAYLGYLENYSTIIESIQNQDIENIVYGAMKESGNVLIKEYGFNKEEHREYINKTIKRFKNPYLKDQVIRVGRNPLRKIGENDRLIKPLKGTIKYNLDNKNLIKGISAALSYNYLEDEEAVEMKRILKENNIEKAISKITGLDIDSKELKEIKKEYLERKDTHGI